VAGDMHRSGLCVYKVKPAIHRTVGLTAYPSLAELNERVDIVDRSPPAGIP